ncbi:MAG: hypothetical protein NTW98_02760 [Candidatus Nomurabacteria bacterium]|nr:hypothetical protein [Candidatus Nomurabacteria bacterium]
MPKPTTGELIAANSLKIDREVEKREGAEEQKAEASGLSKEEVKKRQAVGNLEKIN